MAKSNFIISHRANRNPAYSVNLDFGLLPSSNALRHNRLLHKGNVVSPLDGFIEVGGLHNILGKDGGS